MKSALDGIKVLDFSQFIAGPFATMMLGDMGAEIIKIEQVDCGDSFREWTFFNQWFSNHTSPAYLAWNRNKKSLAINLKDEKAREIILQLVQECDIVVENFRPGVMEKLGFDYESLKIINPKIIFASNSGYGASGPYALRPGQDILAQSLSGLLSLTGRKDAPPTPLGTGLPDMLSSFHLVYAILSAYIYRLKTGIGQKIEVDLLRSTMALESQELMAVLNLKLESKRPASGIGHPFTDGATGIYGCMDGCLAIVERDFSKVRKVLKDTRLTEIRNVGKNRDELFWELEEILKEKEVAYWLEVLEVGGVVAAPIKDIMEVADDIQVKHMQAITTMDTSVGKLKCIAPVVTMSETPLKIQKSPPMVGEDSEEILRSLGVSSEAIQRLYSLKVIS